MGVAFLKEPLVIGGYLNLINHHSLNGYDGFIIPHRFIYYNWIGGGYPENLKFTWSDINGKNQKSRYYWKIWCKIR